MLNKSLFARNPNFWYRPGINEFTEKVSYINPVFRREKFAATMFSTFSLAGFLSFVYLSHFIADYGFLTPPLSYVVSCVLLFGVFFLLYNVFVGPDVRGRLDDLYRREILEEEKEMASFRKSLIGTEHSVLRRYTSQYFPKFEVKEASATVDRVNGDYLSVKITCDIKGIRNPVVFDDEWTLEQVEKFTCSNAYAMRRMVKSSKKGKSTKKADTDKLVKSRVYERSIRDS